MNKIAIRINANKVINPNTSSTNNHIAKSIFLAGPITDWREKAIKYLYDHGYDGTIFNPEVSTQQYNNNYDNQFKWEHEHLDKADLIIFWIPRDISNGITGLATNIEFGLYAHSNKLVVGIPSAEKEQYIINCCDENNIPLFYTLEETLNYALEKLSSITTNIRTDIECNIPLFIWQNNEFQTWYQQQIKIGNKLLGFKCLYSFFMPKAKVLFLWICHVKMYIAAEDRIKDNEFILSRSNISSVVMYYKNNIVLIKEYRSPCCNNECYVYELPGGSEINNINNIQIAIDEVKQETDIEINSNRLQLINCRQAIATLSTHHIYAYKLELTKQEFEKIKKQENTLHGLHKDSEYTYLTIKSIDEIITNSLVDWANIGIILSALK